MNNKTLSFILNGTADNCSFIQLTYNDSDVLIILSSMKGVSDNAIIWDEVQLLRVWSASSSLMDPLYWHLAIVETFVRTTICSGHCNLYHKLLTYSALNVRVSLRSSHIQDMAPLQAVCFVFFLLFTLLQQGYWRILTVTMGVFTYPEVTQKKIAWRYPTILGEGNRCGMTMRWHWGDHRHLAYISRKLHCNCAIFENHSVSSR